MNYPKNILCFATSTNTPGLLDGKYFCAEANRAIGEWKAATIVKVPNDKNRSDLVLEEIDKYELADVYAFFMHGSINDHDKGDRNHPVIGHRDRSIPASER